MPIIGRVSKTRLLESARLKLTEYCTDLCFESLCDLQIFLVEPVAITQNQPRNNYLEIFKEK